MDPDNPLTLRYASRATHRRKDLCQRDDVEVFFEVP